MKQRLPLLLIFLFAAVVVLVVHFLSLIHIHEIHDPVNDTPALHNRQSVDQTIKKFLELNQTLLELHNKINNLHKLAAERGNEISALSKDSSSSSSVLTTRKLPQLSAADGKSSNGDNIQRQFQQPPDDQEEKVKELREESQRNQPASNVETKTPLKPRTQTKRKALIFTMDSITSYEENSQRGGASGEILIRKSLEQAFAHFGVTTDVMTSDDDFNYRRMNGYDFIILDPWTWAAKGYS